MAFETPQINTNISTPDAQTSLADKSLLAALLQGMQGQQAQAQAKQQSQLKAAALPGELAAKSEALTNLIKGKPPGPGMQGPREQPIVGPNTPVSVEGVSVHPVDTSLKHEMQAQREQNHKDQLFTQTQQMLESARGNPEVSQALKDRYSASKALSLINKGDPDKMTPQQVSLLVSEVSKIATGGVPTSAEMQALDPHTLASKFAGISQKLMNEPTAANAGAFVKQYKSYLDDLNSNANGVIKNKLGRVIDSRKAMLGPDYHETLKQQYLDNPELPPVAKSSGQETVQANPVDKLSSFVKGSGPHGPAVTQGGKVYRWNSQSGKYE